MSEEVTQEAPVAEEVAATKESTQEEVVQEEQTEQTSEGVQAETTEELKQEIEDAVADGASDEEVKSMIKEFQLKVNGRDFTKKIDLSDEDAIKRELQLAAAGRQAMQETAELKKALTGELQRLKSEPFNVLKELGYSEEQLEELVYNFAQERVQQQQKSPEQLAKEETERQIEEYRKQIKQLEQEKNEAESLRLRAEAAQQLDEEIDAALGAHTSLAPTPRVIQKITEVLGWAMDEFPNDNISVEQIMPTVERELKEEFSAMMDALPEESIEQWIGKKTVDRLRDKRIKAAKKVESASAVKKVAAPKKEEPRKKQRIEDFLRS